MKREIWKGKEKGVSRQGRGEKMEKMVEGTKSGKGKNVTEQEKSGVFSEEGKEMERERKGK